jgi:hypothetical protein
MTSGNAGQPRVRGQLARERWSSSRLGPVGLGRIPDGEHFPCLTFLVCHKPAPEPWSARARGTCEAYKNRLVRQLEAYGPEGHLGAGPGRLTKSPHQGHWRSTGIFNLGTFAGCVQAARAIDDQVIADMSVTVVVR